LKSKDSGMHTSADQAIFKIDLLPLRWKTEGDAVIFNSLSGAAGVVGRLTAIKVTPARRRKIPSHPEARRQTWRLLPIA